jgi:hypothetical protein
METELCTLAKKYGVDKCTGHSYTPVYNELLTNLRSEKLSILEIGIGNMELMKPYVLDHYKPGASLRMWRDYFPNAEIFGCDIVPEVIFTEERIKTFLVDQSNTVSLLQLMNSIKSVSSSMELDIILDDGSHIEEHMRLSFKTLWQFLKKGGIYIIEDIQSPMVERFERLGIDLGFTDSECIKVHKGLHIWDNFVAYRKN